MLYFLEQSYTASFQKSNKRRKSWVKHSKVFGFIIKRKNSFVQGVVCILAVYVSFNSLYIEEGGVCTVPELKFIRT